MKNNDSPSSDKKDHCILPQKDPDNPENSELLDPKHPEEHETTNKFFQETTIHGLKEAWLIDNKPMKYLWLSIMLSCIFCVSYEIYQIVTYYNSNPTATQVKWVVEETYNYPDMVFCPKTFIDMEKVAKLQMSKSALAYTVSLFHPVYQEKLPAEFKLEDAKNEVKTIMKMNNINTYLDLFRAIGFDEKDILRDVTTKEPVKLDLFVPGQGLCYKINLPPLESSIMKNVNPVGLEHVPSNKTTEYDSDTPAALLIRDMTGSKSDMILMPKNAYYHIDFQVQVHKRWSRPEMKCYETSEINETYYITDCEWTCLDNEKYSSGCRNCLPFQLVNQYNDTTVEPCTTIMEDFVTEVDESKKKKHCDTHEIIQRAKGCLSTCLPVCTQTVYTHSTLVFDNYNSSIFIRLLYNPSHGILTYEEVPTYTFDTFISNIGGQMGLWMGTSIVSIFQIFYYCCSAALLRKQKRKAKESEIVL